MNDNQEFDSVKQYLSLSVGVVPQCGVTVDTVDLYEASTETVVEVVEGDVIALTCYARDGYPAAEVSWQYNVFNETDSVSVEEVVLSSPLPSSPLVTVARRVMRQRMLFSFHLLSAAPLHGRHPGPQQQPHMPRLPVTPRLASLLQDDEGQPQRQGEEDRRPPGQADDRHIRGGRPHHSPLPVLSGAGPPPAQTIHQAAEEEAVR